MSAVVRFCLTHGYSHPGGETDYGSPDGLECIEENWPAVTGQVLGSTDEPGADAQPLVGVGLAYLHTVDIDVPVKVLDVDADEVLIRVTADRDHWLKGDLVRLATGTPVLVSR